MADRIFFTTSSSYGQSGVSGYEASFQAESYDGSGRICVTLNRNCRNAH